MKTMLLLLTIGICTQLRNDKKINLPSDFAIFRYTSLKSLVLAPLSLRFSTRLSKNGFIRVDKFIFSSFLSAADGSITFTLHNSSLKSVPLKIPGVMNPNLSPMSNSGVSLEAGQEIFFKYKNRKYLLLKVGSKLNGTKVDVPKLIKERVEELNLKEKKCFKKKLD